MKSKDIKNANNMSDATAFTLGDMYAALEYER